MKQSEKAKAMTPEERKAWRAKMAAAQAAKRAARAAESTVIVEKKKPKKTTTTAAETQPTPASTGADEDWLL